MEIQIFFNIFLIIHLIGFTILVGTTIIDYVTFKLFWSQYRIDIIKAKGIALSLSKFPVLIRIGAATLVFSGVGMMALTHGIMGEQMWFRIKFALVIFLLLNIFVVGRKQFSKLKKHLDENETENPEALIPIKQKLAQFHNLQFVLFLAILILSIFKFN